MSFENKPLVVAVKQVVKKELEKQEEDDWENIYQSHHESLNDDHRNNQNIGYGSGGQMVYI